MYISTCASCFDGIDAKPSGACQATSMVVARTCRLLKLFELARAEALAARAARSA
jgi:hypothetical protein